MKIKSIMAYEILASGGLPTVECKVESNEGYVATASVSYGASAGSHEASVLNDGDKDRYSGKGVLGVCETINSLIAPRLTGLTVFEPDKCDKIMIEMDGSEQKVNLGGNAILAVSMALHRLAAKSSHMELWEYLRKIYKMPKTNTLPKPMVVAIEGGAHADNSTDLQEYLLSVTHSTSPKDNIRVASEVYVACKKILKEKGLSTNVGNEGAFAPEGITDNRMPLVILTEAVKMAGYKIGVDVWLSLDCAASEFFGGGYYHLKKENKKLKAPEMMIWYESLISDFPILTIEDMYEEDMWKDWSKFVKKLGGSVAVIGDDLTVTNTKRLQRAIDDKAISGILIKLNQAGSVSETIAACRLAKENNLLVIPSHRGGGESNDTFLVDLAVAVGADFIKVGITRGERVCKYNRLMEIERDIQKN